MTLDEARSSIKNLNANKDSTTWDTRTYQLAPHKPFLLLSIIDGIEIGWIKSPNITLSQDLIDTFFRYWKRMMGDDRNTTIALPFFHMKSEPFWELQYNGGMKPYKNSPSLGGLLERVAYAKLNDDLFAMLNIPEEKQQIIETILQTYFSTEIRDDVLNIHHINVGAYQYSRQLELLAAEPFIKYHTDDKSESSSWQKIQQREYGFRIKVRDNYKHRCAICRAKVRTPNGKSLVEGAHIIPWSKSKNDDPRNGLALCKTHHWMYDAYLLTVQPDYRIKLSSWLKKNGDNIDQTLARDHTEIHLPTDQRFRPSELALEEHYEQFKSAS